MKWFNTSVQVLSAVVCGWMGYILLDLYTARWLDDPAFWLGLCFCIIAVLNIVTAIKGFLK